MKKNNIALDIMMGLLCIVCACSIIGLIALDGIFEHWKEMRV